MKKLLLIVILISICLCVAPATFAVTSDPNTQAETNSDTKLQGNPDDIFSLDETKEQSMERANIINALTNAPKEFLVNNKEALGRKELDNVQNANDLSYGIPYQVIIFNKEGIAALISQKNITQASKNLPYIWEVPILFNGTPIATCTVDQLNGTWQVVEVGGDLFADQIDFSTNSKRVKNLLSASSVGNITSVKHIRIPGLHSDYLLVSNDREHMIPIKDNAELQTMRVYDVQQVSENIEKRLEKFDNSNLDAGYPQNAQNPNKTNNVWIFIGITLLVVATGVVSFRRLYLSKR